MLSVDDFSHFFPEHSPSYDAAPRLIAPSRSKWNRKWPQAGVIADLSSRQLEYDAVAVI